MNIKVSLPNHQYILSIQKGSLKHVGSWVASIWQPQRVFIITDENVKKLYGDQVIASLQSAGFSAKLKSVPSGEPSKSLQVAEELYNELAEYGMTRRDGIIALGGGVVGDLAGFVASTFMRGLHFLQIPTTLLAQVDSSIGGKTAVNTKKAKNLVGTFAQPDGVLIDPDTLGTLDTRRISEGIAEIVKSAAIADRQLWQRLKELKNQKELIEHAEEIIAACCEIKRKVVEEDEKDEGQRLILNFGHTIGHALEQNAGYGVVAHGEAVAIGMVQINSIAEQKHLTPEGTTDELIDMLTKFGLPITHSDWDEIQLFEALTHDKKTSGQTLRIILLEEIGQAKIVTIQIDEMRAYLTKRNEV